MDKTKKSAATPTPASGEAKLRVGDVFLKDDIEHVVWYSSPQSGDVKYSRLSADTIQYAIREEEGKPRFIGFMGKGAVVVPATTKLIIVRSLGREGLAKEIDALKAAAAEAAPKKKAKSDKPRTPGLRSGSLGDYKGFSIASVVRALAAAGWNAKEIRAAFNNENIECSDQTIKLNVYRSNRFPDHVIAPLKKVDFPERPKLAADAAPEKEKSKPAPAPKPAKQPIKKTPPAPAPKPAIKPAAKVNNDRAANQIAKLKAARKAA